MTLESPAVLESRSGPDGHLSDADIRVLNEELSHLPPGEILAWALRYFGDSVAASSSFQTQSMPLLHMISEDAPEMPVLFLDTGFHFAETLAFRDSIVAEWRLRVIDLTYEGGHTWFRSRFGELHRADPDECCRLNKVVPMERALSGYRAWVAGIRRDQTAARRSTDIISRRPNGLIKICPLVEWTSRDIGMYISRHGLPSHPLLEQGYLSVGCAPCTRSSFDGERSGRWAGTGKTECGLHGDRSLLFSPKDAR